MSGSAIAKGHRDENFPVASILVAREHRPAIMAFYRFARAADDVADDPALAPETKRARLAAMRAGLDGPEGEGAPEAAALGRIQTARGIDPVHAHELLDAFVRDVAVRRYATWDELIGYGRLSAMPVGRFVLDLHGEDRATWARSDSLCAALQIVNHLQDCGADARALDRVYLPGDLIAHHGATVADLRAPAATPALRAAIADAAARTRDLLAAAAGLAGSVRSRRLALEIAVIQRLAEDLAARLRHRDPLATRVAHGRRAAIGLTLGAVARHVLGTAG